MAGRIKHMERSHRSCGKHQSEFGRFEIRANLKKQKKDAMKTFSLSGIADMFKNFFRKGDR